jgi:hypothetical protein
MGNNMKFKKHCSKSAAFLAMKTAAIVTLTDILDSDCMWIQMGQRIEIRIQEDKKKILREGFLKLPGHQIIFFSVFKLFISGQSKI